MDVLTALLACSLYPADDALVHAIAESNSESNPYFVYDPTLDPAEGQRQPDPHSLDQAVAREADVIAKRAVPLLGLFEIPPAWVAAFGRESAEAFDPCTNTAIATAWLSTFESECARAAHAAHAPHSKRVALEQRPCVLRRYAEALHMPDVVTVVTLEVSAQRPTPLAIFNAPIFAPAAARPWGPDHVFAPLTSLLTTPARSP